MKIFLLSLFVVAAFAAPAPLDEEIGEPVELIVNGLADGEPLEIGDVLDIKVKEHVNGNIVSATNILHPLTAVGLAEAAAAQAPEPVQVVEAPEIVEITPDPVQVVENPEIVEVKPDPVIVVDIPEVAEIKPEPIDLLPPVIPSPQIPDLIIDPSLPVPVPDPIVIPEPVIPELELPEPAPQFPTGEIFNDGVVQVNLNAPEPGVLANIQSWFNMVLNYFNGSVQSTHQIV